MGQQHGGSTDGRNLRLALISLHADPSTPAGFGGGGGTHSYLRELLSYLSTEGIEHLLLTRRTARDLPEFEPTSPTGAVRRLKIGDLAPIDKRLLPRMHKETLERVSEALSSWGAPHLVHSIYWNSGEAAMDFARSAGISFVHSVISNGCRRELSGYRDQPAERIPTERRVFSAAAAIFCVSTQERDDLAAFYGVSAERLVVVGRPVAPAYLHPAHDPAGRPCLRRPKTG
jgi:glycosyltransferase involved in cell wall biosynthesis